MMFLPVETTQSMVCRTLTFGGVSCRRRLVCHGHLIHPIEGNNLSCCAAALWGWLKPRNCRGLNVFKQRKMMDSP